MAERWNVQINGNDKEICALLIDPALPNLHSENVNEAWSHVAAHIDTMLCLTAAELIKVATDKHEQLQASNVTDLSQLVWAEMQRQQQ